MFSKNIKSIMTITMLLVMSLGSVVLFADCDMMAMQSKTNFLISNIEDPDGDTPNDFDDPVDYFDYIRERSADYYSSYCQYVSAYKENDDGYGFCYFKEDNFEIQCFYPEHWNPLNQAWYLHGEDDDTNNATILLGHARQGTWGTGNHPFRFEHNNRTYIFMHNGGLDDQFKAAVRNYLVNSGWFDDPNHSSCWNVTPSNMVDSELFFHYLMKFVIENNYDLISGIHDAITQTDIEGCNIRDKIEWPTWITNLPGEDIEGYINVTNFVLSDGENLYVFRNSPSSDTWHELSYKDNGTFYSVKTLHPRGGNIMNKLDFVVISRDEEPIVYSNFLEMKIFSDGYNWESFPLLVRDATINEPVDVVPILETIEPFNDI